LASVILVIRHCKQRIVLSALASFMQNIPLIIRILDFETSTTLRLPGCSASQLCRPSDRHFGGRPFRHSDACIFRRRSNIHAKAPHDLGVRA
jgi:hypothetical protein